MVAERGGDGGAPALGFPHVFRRSCVPVVPGDGGGPRSSVGALVLCVQVERETSAGSKVPRRWFAATRERRRGIQYVAYASRVASERIREAAAPEKRVHCALRAIPRERSNRDRRNRTSHQEEQEEHKPENEERGGGEGKG